ncbi:hypothetical protein BESB_040760 [Besnoitia besnoiti]|uniref:Uncharacterized protein n=1 Tax=Besnoitia besnoiti TaxID=94643 RepID=A0A2A9MGI1_BESBE|nr:hypothetical protein BESB_040760 [Besnoitia besnoiti]PFH37618.1 hypothetical protein BESB_040760 [Besnoitia besnoiti]
MKTTAGARELRRENAMAQEPAPGLGASAGGLSLSKRSCRLAASASRPRGKRTLAKADLLWSSLFGLGGVLGLHMTRERGRGAERLGSQAEEEPLVNLPLPPAPLENGGETAAVKAPEAGHESGAEKAREGVAVEQCEEPALEETQALEGIQALEETQALEGTQALEETQALEAVSADERQAVGEDAEMENSDIVDEAALDLPETADSAEAVSGTPGSFETFLVRLLPPELRGHAKLLSVVALVTLAHVGRRLRGRRGRRQEGAEAECVQTADKKVAEVQAELRATLEKHAAAEEAPRRLQEDSRSEFGAKSLAEGRALDAEAQRNDARSALEAAEEKVRQLQQDIGDLEARASAREAAIERRANDYLALGESLVEELEKAVQSLAQTQERLDQAVQEAAWKKATLDLAQRALAQKTHEGILSGAQEPAVQAAVALAQAQPELEKKQKELNNAMKDAQVHQAVLQKAESLVEQILSHLGAQEQELASAQAESELLRPKPTCRIRSISWRRRNKRRAVPQEQTALTKNQTRLAETEDAVSSAVQKAEARKAKLAGAQQALAAALKETEKAEAALTQEQEAAVAEMQERLTKRRKARRK